MISLLNTGNTLQPVETVVEEVYQVKELMRPYWGHQGNLSLGLEIQIYNKKPVSQTEDVSIFQAQIQDSRLHHGK